MNIDTTDKALWAEIEYSEEKSEALNVHQRSYTKDVWFRFRHKATSIIGLVLILFILMFALIGPLLTPHTYNKQNLAFVNIPPRMDVFIMGDDFIYVTKNLKPILVAEDGTLLEALPRIEEKFNEKTTTYDFHGETITIDWNKAIPKLIDKNGARVMYFQTVRNKTYLLGTDNLGRDLLARLMMGAKISLLVAFIAAFANLIIGILYGGISAYSGGNVDNAMMRIVDIISTIPLTLYVILIMVILNNNSGFLSIVIALGSVYWVDMARVVRGQILSVKEQDFVYAAKTMGTKTWYILIKHLIPNAMGPIIVTVTMLIPSAIFIEAFMSFIGLGVSPPIASWGTMCNDALQALRTNPYQLFAPSFAICLTMIGFNFVGDGLRDALDPKLKGR